MNIVLITSLFPNRNNKLLGMFNYSRCKALMRSGCNVKVIAPVSLTPPFDLLFDWKKLLDFVRDQYTVPAHDIYNNIEVHYPKWMWLPKKAAWKYEAELLELFISKKVSSILNSFNPDIILLSWMNPFGPFTKYLKAFKIPKVLILEGSDFLIYPKKFRGFSRIEKDIIGNINLLISVSEACSKAAVESFSTVRRTVIKNGYDEKLFSFDHLIHAEKSEITRIVSTGTHTEIKGHWALIKAVHELGEKYRLTLCGEGNLTGIYKDYVLKNNLENRISILGTVDHNRLKALYSEQDIYCQPSLSEGYPSAPLEALACGLPVIAADCGGLPEIVKEGKNGFLFRTGSLEDLKRIIIKTACNEWNRIRIAEEAAENGWSSWADKFLYEVNKFNINGIQNDKQQKQSPYISSAYG